MTHSKSASVLQQTSVVKPLYYINGVMYSPPGRTSVATYAAGSTFGTTVSAASSFTTGVSVSASADNLAGTGAGFSVTVSKSDGTTSTDGKEFKLSMQTSQPVQSNGTDYVDHAADRIYIWPQPIINVVYQPPVGSATSGQASWSFGPATGQGPFFSFAQWLNQPSTMPASVASYLSGFGVTSQYYNEILQNSDPFALGLGSSQLDPSRFILQTTLPFEPVLPTQPYPAPAVSYQLSKAYTFSSSVRKTSSYTVSATMSGPLFFFKLANTSQWVWSSNSDFGNSTANTSVGTVALAPPPSTYTGPIFVDVYLDTLYNTFFFVQHS